MAKVTAAAAKDSDLMTEIPDTSSPSSLPNLPKSLPDQEKDMHLAGTAGVIHRDDTRLAWRACNSMQPCGVATSRSGSKNNDSE